MKIIPRIEEKRGFTLIELLVVIAIIALLSSVVLAALGAARAKARDARRVADLRSVQVALELYYDKYTTYLVANAGASALGLGWLTGENWGSYTTTSVSRVLYNEGFLNRPYVDGPLAQQGISYDYMVYVCDIAGLQAVTPATAQVYALFATKEIPIAAEIAFASTTCLGPGRIASYGKNYAVANRTF
jgi:prepilin-type N-terminal cleavage/methylation domain-containing protein